MLKKSLLIALGALMAQGAFAEALTPEEALARAEGQGAMRRVAPAVSAPRLAYTANSLDGRPAVYVFNQEGGGSLLLPASDLAIPVLGYTDSGAITAKNMPPQLRAWLDSYAAQISAAESSGMKASGRNAGYNYPSEWTYIAPLCKTTWDQSEPYNNDLSTPYASKVATGCVATAMAQIMKYHNFPETGHGTINYSYRYPNENSQQYHFSMDFGAQKFDWANMLDSYSGSYTNAQASAVAYLMKACAYSTEMVFGPSSGTQVENAAIALPTYFNYDGSIEALQRFEYDHTEWVTILYDQLKNVGPVLYSGHSIMNMAHAFVCDGYDGNGYFHFNWGWSGMANGYYSVDALSPAVQGTGGADYGGYIFTQEMIVNIKPDKGASQFYPEGVMTLQGNMSGEITQSNLRQYVTLTMTEAFPGNLLNNSLKAINPSLALMFEDTATGEAMDYITSYETYFAGERKNLSVFGPGTYIAPQFSVRFQLNGNLPDGRYKAQLLWRNSLTTDPTWQEFLIPIGCYDYVYITKKGSEYTVENIPMDRLVIDKCELLTPLYMRNPAEFRFTLTNNSDYELSQSIVPVLLYGENRTLALEANDSRIFTVAPHSTTQIDAVFTFKTVSNDLPTSSKPKEYTLGAYDFSMLFGAYYGTGHFGESYYGDLGTVEMARPASGSEIMLRGVSVDNAEGSAIEDGIRLWRINDPSNIQLTVTVLGKTGFVAAPFNAVVYEYDPVSRKEGAIVYEKNFENLVYASEGETREASTSLNIRDFDPSQIYCIKVQYVQQNALKTFTTVYVGASAGVEDVIGEDADAPAEYYNLQGVRLSEPQPGQIVIVRRGNSVTKEVVR